jgi:hypothetical protein
LESLNAMRYRTCKLHFLKRVLSCKFQPL